MTSLHRVCPREAEITHPNGGPIQPRIQELVRQFVSPDHLQERLQELPQQWIRPRPRPWAKIAWDGIDPNQVQGMTVATFCRVLAGSINTEAPIHGYTQASRQYLERFHPQMAAFVGGRIDGDGQVIELGLWEIEEKRHTPALIALYTRLSGQKPTVNPHAARPYTPGNCPRQDLYRHGLHRIATEYGATGLYLWLMAHTTGPLQAVLAELVRDELNHLTKFWGFGRWAYPQAGLGQVVTTLGKALVQKWRNPQLQGSLAHTLRRMMGELGWEHWSAVNRLTFLHTLDQVMRVLWRWDRQLSQDALNQLFGPPPGAVLSTSPDLVTGE